ncbi:hypothetical protein PAMP_020361 [Pampus punctatissimus]
MTMSTMEFHSQIASIMEALANTAVAEICKVVDDGYAVVHLEMSRSQKENEFLRRKIKLLELQIARYRAERVKGADRSISSRFPGVRLLNRQRDTLAEPSLQSRTRFLNRGQGAQQSVQKTQPINLDQDPDQEVVTTTKTESAEPEEEEDRELLIVKVEGALETSANSDAALKDASKMEVSGSDIVTFVVGRTAETDNTTHSPQLELTQGDVRAGESQPTTSPDNPTSCDDVMDGRKDNDTQLDTSSLTSKSSMSEVIVIDGGGTSDKEAEECEWSDGGNTSDTSSREAGRGRDRHEQTTSPMIQCVGLESACQSSVQGHGCLKNTSSPQSKEEKMDEVQGDAAEKTSPSQKLLEWRESSETEAMERPSCSTFSLETISRKSFSQIRVKPTSNFPTVPQTDQTSSSSKFDVIMINSLPCEVEDSCSVSLLSVRGDEDVTPLGSQGNASWRCHVVGGRTRP